MKKTLLLFLFVLTNITVFAQNPADVDLSFPADLGFNNTVYSTAEQQDGKILTGGAFTTFDGLIENKLVRLNSIGSKDNTFNIGNGFNDDVRTLVIQSDGKILVGGNFTSFDGVSQNRLIRLNSDGTKDNSFNIGIGFNDIVRTIKIQTDGKILVDGNFNSFKATLCAFPFDKISYGISMSKEMLSWFSTIFALTGAAA